MSCLTGWEDVPLHPRQHGLGSRRLLDRRRRIRPAPHCASRSDGYACAYSPDGREILFTSNRTGHDQVFVVRADGSHPRNLSRTVTDDEATQWHP